MLLCIVWKEIIGNNENSLTTVNDFYQFEIMDGYPLKECQIPVWLFLAGV